MHARFTLTNDDSTSLGSKSSGDSLCECLNTLEHTLSSLVSENNILAAHSTTLNSGLDETGGTGESGAGACEHHFEGRVYKTKDERERERKGETEIGGRWKSRTSLIFRRRRLLHLYRTSCSRPWESSRTYLYMVEKKSLDLFRSE